MQRTCAKIGTQKVFRTEEDGNLSVFAVLMLIIILTVAGASVDIMRLESNRAAMQVSLDRAVLAAADLDQQQNPETVVGDYLSKAGPDERNEPCACRRGTELSHRVGTQRTQPQDVVPEHGPVLAISI